MLMCDQTATLIQCDQSGDADVYICTVMRGVSWFARTEINVGSSTGVQPENSYRVRIPASCMTVMPKVGDYMAKGEVAGVSKLSDIHKYESFHITAVGDNRRGNLAHVVVSGA